MTIFKPYYLPFLIAHLTFFTLPSRAQNNFEILIPWENDICVSGLYAREINDNSIFILSNNYEFDSGPGLPIEGPIIYGTGLIKVSQNGNVVLKKNYYTNGPSSVQSTGRVAATSFYPLQNSIIIPFSMYVGIVTCDSVTGADTYKTGILQADMLTGNAINMYLYNDDTLCSQDNFSAFAILNDSTTFAIESRNNKSFVWIRTISDSLISKYPVDSNYSVGTGFYYEKQSQYEPSDTSFLLIVYDKLSKSKKIVKINFRGAITELFPINYYMPFETFDNSFYFLHDEYDSIDGKYTNTRFLKFSSTGAFLKEINFTTIHPIDLKITLDKQILLLCNKPLTSFSNPIPLPIRVFVLDTNLNIISYNDFGFPFVIPSYISLSSDSGFIVTGTRLKSVDEDNGKEPDQVYLLKSQIDSINIPYTNIKVPDKTVESLINVHPNPVNNHLTLQFQTPTTSSVQFILHDYTGKQISRIQKNHLPEGKHTEQFNTSQLSPGIYLLIANINGQIQTFKILKI